MKKLAMLLALAVTFATGAFGYTAAITTNATATMIVPPVGDYSVQINQISERSGTNATAISMGSLYRIGTDVIIAANSGTRSTNATITVVETGLSAADGTVYWFKVHPSRTTVIVQPTITSGATVYYKDVRGNYITEATSLNRTEFRGYNGAIYGRASATNCTATVLSW